MKPVRKIIGGLGNLMFKEAFIYSMMHQGIIPDLYVQGIKYWQQFDNEIKQRFNDGIGYDERVAIHVRRGDYLQTNFYVNLWETDYYQRALQYFPNSKFLIFCSDRQDSVQDEQDREWCYWFFRGLLPNGNFEIHKPLADETDDLNAMASCKGIIMANSSFSWWAAFLNPNPNKKVICPKMWFKDGIQRCELLDEWIKI